MEEKRMILNQHLMYLRILFSFPKQFEAIWNIHLGKINAAPSRTQKYRLLTCKCRPRPIRYKLQKVTESGTWLNAYHTCYRTQLYGLRLTGLFLRKAGRQTGLLYQQLGIDCNDNLKFQPNTGNGREDRLSKDMTLFWRLKWTTNNASQLFLR